MTISIVRVADQRVDRDGGDAILAGLVRGRLGAHVGAGDLTRISSERRSPLEDRCR